MSIVFLNNLAIHYESLGRGRPVVFLHTWVGSWRYWVPSMQATATSHSAYALDLFGFGDTAKDPRVYSPEHQVGLLGGFLDEMGIGRFALVGHGLGALIGLAFARAQPSRIVRMMAIALPLEATAVDGRLYSSDPADLVDLLGGKLAAAADLLPKGTATDARAIRVLAESLEIHGALSGLHERDVACLLVYGANDPLFRAPSPEQATLFGPNVHQVILPDTGHFPMLDAPTAFHRLLIDFLALEQGTSPRELQPREEWRRRVR